MENSEIPYIKDYYFTCINTLPYKDIPYTAPEIRDYTIISVVCGKMHNHPKFSNGQIVTTSEVVSVLDNRYIITQSGSKYLLDNPSYDYTIQRQKDNLPLIPNNINKTFT